jgi:hypothetical protein
MWGPNEAEYEWLTCMTTYDDNVLPAFVDLVPDKWMSDWVIIQSSIRRFYLHGLLLPIDHPSINPTDNYLSTTLTLRKLPRFLHAKLCLLPTCKILNLFPNIDGKYFYINENPSNTEPLQVHSHQAISQQSTGPLPISINTLQIEEMNVTETIDHEYNRVIPLTIRHKWKFLHENIREFFHMGLLIPADNVIIHPEEHFRNMSTDEYRQVPTSIYHKLIGAG